MLLQFCHSQHVRVCHHWPSHLVILRMLRSTEIVSSNCSNTKCYDYRKKWRVEKDKEDLRREMREVGIREESERQRVVFLDWMNSKSLSTLLNSMSSVTTYNRINANLLFFFSPALYYNQNFFLNLIRNNYFLCFEYSVTLNFLLIKFFKYFIC